MTSDDFPLFPVVGCFPYVPTWEHQNCDVEKKCRRAIVSLGHRPWADQNVRPFCALLPNFTRVFRGDSWVKFGSHVCCEKTSRFFPRFQAPTESASWLRAKIKNRSLLTPWPPLLLLLPPPRTPPPAFAARQSQGHHPSYHRTRPDSMHIFSISVFPLSTT